MRKILLAASICAGLASAPAPAQSVKAGIEAWQKADYARATSIWRPLAEAGDPDAQFNLGQAYRLGRGVKLSLAAAQTWFKRAAEQGHLDAQANLGLLLFDNGDRTDAVRWLKTAAERGEPRAMLIYGTAMFNGDGVVRDPVLAYAYVSRSAAQGFAPAKTTLAEMDKLVPLAQRKRGVAIALERAIADIPKTRAAAPAKPGPTRVATPAAKPPVAAPASGGWRIQLGAFGQRGSAEALFRKVSGSLPGRQAYYVPAGAVTRLQVGPYPNRAAAQAACAALRGQPCFPVPAK
jgi:hypothetical protein